MFEALPLKISSFWIRYDGTPLQLDDERLGEIVTWIKNHDLSIVKLDCLMHKVTSVYINFNYSVQISYKIFHDSRNEISMQCFLFR